MQSTRRQLPPVPRTPREAARRIEPIDLRLDEDLFAALADPTRRRLVACVAKCRRPCSVGELAQCCRVDLSVVSRQLRTLKRAAILESRRDGRSVRYSLRATDLAARLREVADAIEEKTPFEADGCRDGCC